MLLLLVMFFCDYRFIDSSYVDFLLFERSRANTDNVRARGDHTFIYDDMTI